MVQQNKNVDSSNNDMNSARYNDSFKLLLLLLPIFNLWILLRWLHVLKGLFINFLFLFFLPNHSTSSIALSCNGTPIPTFRLSLKNCFLPWENFFNKRKLIHIEQISTFENSQILAKFSWRISLGVLIIIEVIGGRSLLF